MVESSPAIIIRVAILAPIIRAYISHGRNCKHTQWDALETVSSRRLYEMGEFSVFYLDYFVDADTFPVARELPEEMAHQLYELLH